MTTLYTDHFRLNLPDFNSAPWHEFMEDNFRKLDSVLFRALMTMNIVVWSHSTEFQVGTIALDETDATFWLSTVTHTSPATGTFKAYRDAHPTIWTAVALGLSTRGAWTNNTSYQYYDMVYDTVLGIVALCTTPHISSPAPANINTDAAKWAFIVNISTILNASTLAFTPAGTISATNVQAAIQEVDGDRLANTVAIAALLDAVAAISYGQIISAAKATIADFTGNVLDKLLPVRTVWDAAAPYDLGNITGTVTLDCGAHLNFIGTLVGNVTLANPTNLKPGQTVSILLTQDGTGTRTVSFGNQWFPVGSAALVFNTAAGKRNYVSAQRMTSATIAYSGGKLE